MSKTAGGGGAHLRPVAADGAAGAAAAAEDLLDPSGLTPPHDRGTSRFISDVIVEMGFLPRERVDAAVEEAKAAGKTPEQVLVASRCDHG